MFNFYSRDNDKGFPGMKANVTVDTVESFAAEGGINPGEGVIRGTDPDKQVKAAQNTEELAKIIGIAVHTHKEYREGKYYAEGDDVSVMMDGDIYVMAGADVTAGEVVAMKFDEETGEQVYTNTTDGGATLPGMSYMESGAAGDIVRVRIRPSGAVAISVSPVVGI